MKIETPAEQLFFVTVWIETETPSHVGVGTGFMVRHRWADNKEELFLVSNKHVIRDAKKGRFYLLRSDGTSPMLGQKYDVEIDDFEQAWFSHPDPEVDVAVLPMAGILRQAQSHQWKIYFKCVSREIIPSKSQLEDLDAIEEVVFVGYPSGIWDTKNFLPVARRGTTATPVSVDYGGRPIFLVDASVFPGSSGSPVFICNVGGYSHRGGLVVRSRVLFLGIVSLVYFREDDGTLNFVDIPTAVVPAIKTRQMIDLAIVFKAQTIFETIEAFLRDKGELE